MPMMPVSYKLDLLVIHYFNPFHFCLVYDLNGKDLMGERVHVEFAREQRGPRGRFGGGGSRYGSGRYESRRGGSYRSGGGSGGLHYAEK